MRTMFSDSWFDQVGRLYPAQTVLAVNPGMDDPGIIAGLVFKLRLIPTDRLRLTTDEPNPSGTIVGRRIVFISGPEGLVAPMAKDLMAQLVKGSVAESHAPPIVAVRCPGLGRQYLVIDGCHRLESAIARGEHRVLAFCEAGELGAVPRSHRYDGGRLVARL
jgi:ParB-like nuclease domain